LQLTNISQEEQTLFKINFGLKNYNSAKK